MHFSAPAIGRNLLLATAAAAFLALASTPSIAQDDPPAQAGRVSYVSGAVSIQPVGDNDWGQAAPNLPLGPGDRLVTDSDGRAEIQVGQTFLRIGPNSDVSFVDSTPYGLSFGVAQGTIHLHCNGLWPGQQVHVNTPNGSFGLNQPSDVRVDVMPDQGASVYTNFSNDALVTGAGGFAQHIGFKQAIELFGTNPVVPQWLQVGEWDELDHWSHVRDEQVANAASYRYVSPEIPGASELDAAGTWQPGTDYGAVWFPNNVPADWAPYHYGHWINHAPWGWVWVEDEPWGYAPFHYGRWVSFNGRWGWVPGAPAAHPVWSPALVVFAGGVHVGGVGVSAWFPLGPGEPYHPWYHASPRYIDQVNITNFSESRRVHVQTTYVNVNVVNITYVNRTIAVSAVSNADFAAGRPVHQAAVRVEAHQFDHVQVIERPEPQPNRQSFIGHPPARPVHVSAERPVLINEQGKLAPAKPGAPPVEPPVKPAPPVRVLPGRTAVAPPPGAATPARPPAGVPAQGFKPATAGAPPAGPKAPPATPTAAPAQPARPAAPLANPAQKPEDRGARPGVPTGTAPAQRPAPGATTRPATPPAPQPATPPTAPKPAADQPARPTPQPTARPVAPVAPRPGTQPAANPTPQPTARPAAPPVGRPATQPAPAPTARPAAPPASTARPVPPPAARPAAPAATKPQPDKKNDKDKKKDDKKDDKKDEKKPQD
jgi:hypothetical protein